MKKYIIKNNNKIVGIIEYDGLIGKFALKKYGYALKDINVVKVETCELCHDYLDSRKFSVSVNNTNQILCSYDLYFKIKG